jgi:hypothetical protein
VGLGDSVSVSLRGTPGTAIESATVRPKPLSSLDPMPTVAVSSVTWVSVRLSDLGRIPGDV